MAGCKKNVNKKVKQKEQPFNSKQVRQSKDPSTQNQAKAAWRFSGADKEMWTISKDALWDEILQKLCSWETMSWNEIFVNAEKQNHPIDVNKLNKIALNRLDQLHIEASSVYSLRLNGTHRLYGLLIDGVFSILWYDTDHGDNPSCVCRSRKKHT